MQYLGQILNPYYKYLSGQFNPIERLWKEQKQPEKLHPVPYSHSPVPLPQLRPGGKKSFNTPDSGPAKDVS
jgi:hypothetical protein